MATIYLLNGPNLNLLGLREPHHYGHETLATLEENSRAAATRLGYELVARQTNAEHEMIDWLQEARTEAAGVVLNPAAFSYHSVPVLDALKMIDRPIVEVHISNLHRREEKWRAHSIMSATATATISGAGIHGYVLAIEHIAYLLAQKAK